MKLVFLTSDHRRHLHEEMLAGVAVSMGYDAIFVTDSEFMTDIPEGRIVFAAKSAVPANVISERGNIVIYDVQDAFIRGNESHTRKRVQREIGGGFIAGVVYENRLYEDEFEGVCPHRYVPHPWDARHGQCRDHTQFRPAYIGDPKNLGAEGQHLLLAKRMEAVFGCMEDWTAIEKGLASNYTCHVDPRDPDDEWGRLKPNSKLATAVGCTALFVTTRTGAATQLLPDDYPYFARKGKVGDMLDYARATWGQEPWRYAMLMLMGLRLTLAPSRAVEAIADFGLALARDRHIGLA